MTLEMTRTSYYRVGGNLPPDAPSYVTREADEQLYQKLKKGEFCYVLNSRQMGKSSLWVRVKQRLQQEDYICAAIDLSGIGQGEKKEWYTSFANRLTKSFNPVVKKQWRLWWKEQLELAPMEKLHQLIEELLLPSLLPHQKLVIFIDEIDYVKGLPFSTDEFFALIRSFYNDRSLNPQFNQVTFCLLGVATPADLIENKQLTSFNIGTSIELQGFRKDETETLIAGLKGSVVSPESVMSDILYWTGGQPFLTQRLCSLVVKENNPTPDIPELVHRQIIDNWETQDEQEHLRTIKNRIFSNEQRAGYLLELYRKVLKQGQVPLNNSAEERELQLSGLVVKRGNVLEVYNPIYARVFNESWIDSELGKLRPYAENYRAWLQSGKIDASRLLRGQALKDAEAWASGKNLGGEDRDFLGASRAQEREEEIANKDKEAQLERERQAKEVAESANRQAQRTIRWGLAGLAAISVSAIIVIGFADIKWDSANQRISQANKNLAEAYQQLDSRGKIDNSPVILQIHVKLLSEQASLLRKQGNTQRALAIYNEAFDLLQSAPNNLLSNPDIQILSVSNIESVHQELIELLNSSNTAVGLTPDEVRYGELEFYLKQGQWKEADRKTALLMLYKANREKERWLDKDSLDNFSCKDLRKINQLWLDYSDDQFGFSVQKEIWQEVGSPNWNSPIEDWRKFYIGIGWKTEYSGRWSGGYVRYDNLNAFEEVSTSSRRGNLPYKANLGENTGVPYFLRTEHRSTVLVRQRDLFSRAANCNL